MVYFIHVCWQLASRIRTEFRPDEIYHDARSHERQSLCRNL